MLGDYSESQSLAYQILSNEIRSGKTSHAYLFDISLMNNAFPFINAFIKSLLCPNAKLTNDGCTLCNLCSAIDNNNFPDLKLIEADGMTIKKEQLLELQQTFNTTSLYNNKRIYIIKYAENLHISAANSMLKFLEEPADNIVAILLTKNINDVMSTIISRCQIIKLSNQNIGDDIYKNLDIDIDDQIDVKMLFDNIMSFVSYYEKHGMTTLAHSTKLWFENFKDKKQNDLAYKLLSYCYKDVINYKLGRKLEYFGDYTSQIKEISLKNSFDKLYNKMYIVVQAANRNKLNTNLALNLDNMIMEMERSVC